MLYENNGQYFVFANNKYYKLRLNEDGNLVPTRKFEYSLENKVKISYDEVVSKLKPKKVKKNIELDKPE